MQGKRIKLTWESMTDLGIKNATILLPDGQMLLGQQVLIKDGRIADVGDHETLLQTLPDKAITDANGALLTPGFVDCHSHVVYAEPRLAAFRLRQAGLSYAEIAAQGHGIAETVTSTRKASFDMLLERSLPRVQAMIRNGVTTLEIKSGYGLDKDTEAKMLAVARAIGDILPIRIKTTYLGAHALPPEFRTRDAYLKYICEEVLPFLHQEKLVDAVDMFVEHLAFNLEDMHTLYSKAAELGLPVKCHAEQLSCLGASAAASSYRALSCDHLEFLDEAGVLAMAASGTVAVLLPGAWFYLQETHKPPIALLRQHGVHMAIATDCNPGSSPSTSLPFMMHLAATRFGMSVPEVMQGVTQHAAKALGMQMELGSISVGKVADLLLWSVNETTSLCYYFGDVLPHRRMYNGRWCTNDNL